MFAFLLLAAPLLLQNAQAPSPPTRVACLGDSITFGAALKDRERHAYPAQLAYMLGEEYEVRNFGVGGCTLLRDADRPIHRTRRYLEMLVWEPEIVVVILGTNDTCENDRRHNWSQSAALESDARTLVAELRAAGAKRIILGTPPGMFPNAQGLPEARQADLETRGERLPRIAAAYRTVAEESDDVEFMELSATLRPHWTSDGVHPTPLGDEAIALQVHRTLRPEGPIRTLLARPSAEYRGSPAGWHGGNWFGALAHLQKEAAEHSAVPIVFFGDSITQGLTGHTHRAAEAKSTRAIDREFAKSGALSLGLSGDRTEHLLYRIQHGALPLLHPEVIVLQIGANNINAAGDDALATSEGIRAVVKLLREKQPQARVVICGPFPLGREAEDPRRRTVDLVHEQIAGLADTALVDYLDLRPLFLDETGAANEGLAADGIHITPAGQAAWMAAIANHLETAAAD